MTEAIQYLIARQDLQMSPGKLAAQCAHASTAIALSAFTGGMRTKNHSHLPEYHEALQHWIERAFAKVVLRVKSKKDMDKLLNELNELHIPHVPIYDACRTELEPEEEDGSTLTCVGIMPMFRSEVPKCLQKLQVYQ